MKVVNLSKEKLVYNTKGLKIEFFPGLEVDIDEDLVSFKKLTDCFGHSLCLATPEDEVSSIPQVAKAEIDLLFSKGPTDALKDISNPEGTDETPVNHEWEAKIAKAKAYFEDLEQDDDSDKHLKLTIAKNLRDKAAEEEERVCDDVSLMEEIERVFPEEKAKLEEETKKLEEDTINKDEVVDSVDEGPVDENLDPNNIAKGLADKVKELVEKAPKEKAPKEKAPTKTKSTDKNSKKANK